MSEGNPVLALWSNIANTHNEDLLAALRAQGHRVQATYLAEPAEQDRDWHITLAADDLVARGPRQDLARLRAGRGAHLVLSGGWARPRETVRRLAVGALAAPASVLFWGEGLRPGSPVTRAARRAWFAGLRLDGVLAVGRAAVPSYRAVVRAGVPVHVFPYVTGHGLHQARRPAEEFTIGYAGRLIERKGVDTLLHAVGRLSPSDRPLVEIVGGGPLEADLRALAADLEVRVSWLGVREPSEVAAVRSSWWAQVVPNRAWEGWGIVVHEALNGGVPVLASGHVTAATDLVRDGWNGTTVPAAAATDPARWAGVIRSYADPGRVRTEGDRARRTGAAFGPEPAATWLLDLVRSGDTSERDFVTETWRELADDRAGWPNESDPSAG